MEEKMKKVNRFFAVAYCLSIICCWLTEGFLLINTGSTSFDIVFSLFIGVLIPLTTLIISFGEPIKSPKHQK